MTAAYNDGYSTLTAASAFTVSRAVLKVQVPNITRYLSQSRSISADDLILTGLCRPEDINGSSFRVSGIYAADSIGSITPVPTEANTGEYGSYPLIAEASASLDDRYSVLVQNGFYTIAPPAQYSLSAIGEYENSLEIDMEADDKVRVSVRCIGQQSVNLNKIKLFKAEYDADGKLTGMAFAAPVIADDGALTLTTDLPQSDNFKLLLWDEKIRPITNAVTNLMLF